MQAKVSHVVESVPRVVEAEEESYNEFSRVPPDVLDKWNPKYPHNMNDLHELNHYSHTFPFWTIPFVPPPREPYMGEPKVIINVPRVIAN